MRFQSKNTVYKFLRSSVVRALQNSHPSLPLSSVYALFERRVRLDRKMLPRLQLNSAEIRVMSLE